MPTRMQSKGKIIAYTQLTVNYAAPSKQHIVRMNKIIYTHNTWHIIHSSNTQTTRFSVFGRVAKNSEVSTILAYSNQFV